MTNNTRMRISLHVSECMYVSIVSTYLDLLIRSDSSIKDHCMRHIISRHNCAVLQYANVMTIAMLRICNYKVINYIHITVAVTKMYLNNLCNGFNAF